MLITVDCSCVCKGGRYTSKSFNREVLARHKMQEVLISATKKEIFNHATAMCHNVQVNRIRTKMKQHNFGHNNPDFKSTTRKNALVQTTVRK